MGAHPSETDTESHPSNRIGALPPRTRAWRDGKVEAEGFPVAEISDYLERPDVVVWMDLCAPDHKDLHIITEELGLDSVAVEDAVSRRERAKLDRYADYSFLNVYTPELEDGVLELHELSAFVAKRALVTVRQDGGFDIDELIRRWDQSPGLARLDEKAPNVVSLLYGLLDMVVDRQLDTVQALDDEASAVEDLVFDESFPAREIQERTFRLRKNLASMRRVALPMREVVNTLMRRDLQEISPPLMPYFQDVYDHTLHVAEWTENLRDLIGNLLDTRLALQSNRMNEVMKKVTSWAAIIAVPTAVTGYYGQNVPYPGFSQHWGFLSSTAVIIVCSVLLYVVFKVRDWL